jgi:hypothetical protein
MTTQLHFAINTFALQLLLEGAQRLVDIIVANDDLHKKSSNSLKIGPRKAGISAGAGITDKHPAMHRIWVATDMHRRREGGPLAAPPVLFKALPLTARQHPNVPPQTTKRGAGGAKRRSRPLMLIGY